MDGPKQPVATQTPDQGEMRCQLLSPLGTPEGSVVIARSLSAGCLAGRPAAGGPEAGLPAVAIATALRSLTLPSTLSLRAAWPRPVRRPGGHSPRAGGLPLTEEHTPRGWSPGPKLHT